MKPSCVIPRETAGQPSNMPLVERLLRQGRDVTLWPPVGRAPWNRGRWYGLGKVRPNIIGVAGCWTSRIGQEHL